jgi:YppF-like protein
LSAFFIYLNAGKKFLRESIFRGGNIMNVHELQKKFHQLREYTPENVNELLDFAKKAYIHNEISSTDYRNLVRELEAQGAAVPESYKDNTLQDSVNA